MTKRKQPKGRWYRGCFIEPNHHAWMTGEFWQWASYVDGFGGVYADTLAGIKSAIRCRLAEQGLKRSPM